MKRTLLLAILAGLSPAAAAASGPTAREWRAYSLPIGGALQLEVPATWKEEIRQKDRNLPPTVVLRPKRGQDLEILLTPMPAQGGQLPAMADLEAGLIQLGMQHLPTARQDSVTLQKLEGEQVNGRYFLLTEKKPPPDEYPSVIGGGLLTGPLVVSFTILLRDPDGDDTREALRILQSARFQPGFRADLSRVTLPIPGQGWHVSFDTPPLMKRNEADSPDQYMYIASSGRFNLSLYVETPSCDGGTGHADFYNCFWPRASRNPQIVEDSVVATSTERFYKVVYDTLTPWKEQMVRQRHINFLFAYRGKWTDLHISIVEPTEVDGELVAAFEESLSYGE